MNGATVHSDYVTARDHLLADPAVRFWVKDAVRALDRRDPVDAAQDARLLYELARLRVVEACGGKSS